MLGVLALGLVEAGMMGACESSAPGPLGSGSSTSSTGGATECSASVEVPCMRYHIPLDGNPSTNVAYAFTAYVAWRSYFAGAEFGRSDGDG
jgi:hypothetical protein